MKSTFAAAMLTHALTFFPENKAIIINMDQQAGIANIDKVRFMLESLPPWMRFIPSHSKQNVTFIRLTNGSQIKVVYPSTIKTPDQLARSLTIPILYIDEAAFIRNMDRIFGSAQQTLATARIQAEKHKYPYWINLILKSN